MINANGLQSLKTGAANRLVDSYCNRNSQLENVFLPPEKRQEIAGFINPEFLTYINHDVGAKRVFDLNV